MKKEAYGGKIGLGCNGVFGRLFSYQNSKLIAIFVIKI